MQLAYREAGNGSPLIILHGLFGSSDNWQTLGKRFAEDFHVYMVDQRNHGKSPHSEIFNYDILARDLKDFMVQHRIEKATIIGHSMGGKTAMRFAQLFESMVKKLVVVDMGIKQYPPHHEKILQAFHSLDLDSLKSRSEADSALAGLIPDFGVRQFILKNLYRKERDQFAWRVNFKVAEKEMDEILSPLPKTEVRVPALFIYGSKSDYVLEADKAEIQKIFSDLTFVELQAGHWIHAEVPGEFYHEVKNFVTK